MKNKAAVSLGSLGGKATAEKWKGQAKHLAKIASAGGLAKARAEALAKFDRTKAGEK